MANFAKVSDKVRDEVAQKNVFSESLKLGRRGLTPSILQTAAEVGQLYLIGTFIAH